MRLVNDNINNSAGRLSVPKLRYFAIPMISGHDGFIAINQQNCIRSDQYIGSQFNGYRPFRAFPHGYAWNAQVVSIKAIQELIEKNRQLENEVRELKAAVKEMEELSELKSRMEQLESVLNQSGNK